MSEEKVNKSAEIRAWGEKHPEGGPSLCVKALAEKGIEVGAGQVSVVLNKLRHKGTAVKGNKKSAKSKPNLNGALEQLLAFRKAVAELGGWDSVVELHDANEKLNEAAA